MKKIDLIFKEKFSNTILKYKEYVLVNEWLIRFTSEPLKVLTEIKEKDTELFSKLDSVNKGIDKEPLRVKAIEIGIKVISSYANKLYEDIIANLKFITNKENNPLNTLVENTILINKDINSEQLIRYIKAITSSLAYKEYANDKIEKIITPLTTDSTETIDYKIWLNRLLKSIESKDINFSTKLIDKLNGLKQLDIYISKKVDLIKSNLDSSVMVAEKPEGDININTEILEENLEINFNNIITDNTTETIDPIIAIEKLVELLISSINKFDKISKNKDSLMLKNTVLIDNIKLIKKYSNNFVKDEVLDKDFNRLLLEVHNVNTIVIERLEKFISDLINESIKLNHTANIYMHLNIILEKILLEAVIK